MPIQNVTAAMGKAREYLQDYAATNDSARSSKKIDAREFTTYWTMLKSAGRGVAHDRKAVAQLKKDMAGLDMTQGAKELYDEVVDYAGSRSLDHTPPRYNSGGGV